MRTLSFVAFALPLALAANPALAEIDQFGFGTGNAGLLRVSMGTTVVNKYAQLTANVAIGAVDLPVSTSVGFGIGELVLIWQSGGQGGLVSGSQATIDLTSAAPGHWELARIAATANNSIKLSKPLVAAFASDVTQLIKIPEFSDVLLEQTGAIVAQPWDGKTGGILGFFVNGGLTLRDSGRVAADGAGYRGGEAMLGPGANGCVGLDEPAPNGATKGESIGVAAYGPNVTGRGNLGNGGGGGICRNSGGGGGANGGRGGIGGRSSGGDVLSSRPVGGLAGAALKFTAFDHLAMGGGGGAGDIDNGLGTGGAAGGGVIFIRGYSIDGVGKLTANGGTPAPAANPGTDGQGGGGAGGTVYLRTAGILQCGAIEALGGSGGSTAASRHGTGGGGGGGHVLVQMSLLNCPINVNAGAAGTQGDANAPDGKSYGAGPPAPNDPAALGVIEVKNPGHCLVDNHCGGPVCDKVTQTCVPCKADADCVAFRPVCDKLTGSCRTCTKDLECAGKPNTPACTSLGSCGQCSPSNRSLCLGVKPACDAINFVCAACKADADCATTPNTPACQASGACGQCSKSNTTQCKGNMPTCDLVKGVCSGCAVDADCAATPNTPACASGLCVQCSANNKTRCIGNTPACNLMAGTCRACAGDADCGGNTPACQPGGGCGECSKSNLGLCKIPVPACDTVAGKCVACVIGDNAPCVNDANGRLCTSSGGAPFCGCAVDADCGNASSGRVCDGISRRCVNGCAPGRNGCPLGKSCTSMDPKVLGMCSSGCNFNADCAATPQTPICLVSGGAGICVACAKDADCANAAGKVCNSSRICVQCTAMNRAACDPSTVGGACLNDAACGCLDDRDCAMGRSCDKNQSKCIAVVVPPDLSVLPDLTMVRDLAMAADLAEAVDAAVDLAPGPDLLATRDLARGDDLVSRADLRPGADLPSAGDLAPADAVASDDAAPVDMKMAARDLAVAAVDMSRPVDVVPPANGCNCAVSGRRTPNRGGLLGLLIVGGLLARRARRRYGVAGRASGAVER